MFDHARVVIKKRCVARRLWESMGISRIPWETLGVSGCSLRSRNSSDVHRLCVWPKSVLCITMK